MSSRWPDLYAPTYAAFWRTVNVAIRNGNEAVLIGQKRCKSMVRMYAPIGESSAVTCFGAGKRCYPLTEEELGGDRRQPPVCGGLRHFPLVDCYLSCLKSGTGA